MNEYIIQLLDKNFKVNSAFAKANGELLSNHSNKFLNQKDKTKLLEELWLAEYKAVLTKNSIIFDRKQDMTMFLLRWS